MAILVLSCLRTEHLPKWKKQIEFELFICMHVCDM
jgi:hypothetical protein